MRGLVLSIAVVTGFGDRHLLLNISYTDIVFYFYGDRIMV